MSPAEAPAGTAAGAAPDAPADAPWPEEIRIRRKTGALAVLWQGGGASRISAARLRANVPSADRRGHGAAERAIAPPVPGPMTIARAEPVGRYAVRLVFSDGHSAGLFTWALLHRLGEAEAEADAEPGG